MKLKFLIVTLFTFALGFAQSKGTVTGTVTDKDLGNETLPFASVSIKGTSTGANTDENGVYSISVPEGSHTLVITFLGYETAEIPFTITAGETKTIDHALGSTSVTLQDVVIERTINREKETALLLEQKNAVEITQTIGAQEMSRKGVTDAEAALTKMTGISKQEGAKNVFVRGLGDRYNSTTMNGLPLPSEDPINKNISLDFFSSDIIKNIGVNKTFGAEINGDVGGANIDIVSKEFTGKEYIEINASAGINSQTVSEDFNSVDGGNFFGYSNKNSNINNLNEYTFENSMDPNTQSTNINSGFGISGGKRFEIGDNSLSLFLTGSFGNNYLYAEGVERQNNSVGTVNQDYDTDKSSYNVNQSIMGNLKYRFGSNNISFNTLYIHDNTQTYQNYFGYNNPEVDGDLALIKRQENFNNQIIVNQLLSELKLNENLDLNVGAAYNMTIYSEPDRRTNNILLRNDQYILNRSSAGNQERYFASMDEDDFAGNAVMTYTFDNENKSKFNVGYNFRSTARNFEALIFNHRINTNNPIDPNNLDNFFNQENLDNNAFELQTGRGTQNNPNAFDPFYYDVKRMINAGLASFTHTFNPSLTAVVGVRFDKVNQEIEYNTNIASSEAEGPAKMDKSYILPDFNVKYNLNENNIFRLAGSMTYTLPQFIEIAPFKNQGARKSTQGNADLVPSENYNLDLKWEFYPKDDELIAVTGFYKIIKNPIARAEIPSGNTETFFNVGGQATVAGIEAELKKNIYKIEGSDTAPETVFSGGLNLSYLYSKQDLEATLPQFTNSTGQGGKGYDELQGASPLLVNADLTYRRDGQNFDLSSSLVFNYFSDRIYSIGTRGLENQIEKSITTLDFITQTDLGENFGISFKARNLLNPEFRVIREGGANAPEIELENYKRGLDFSLGFSYKF